MLMFAHGFNIHFGCITPPENADVTMIAPKTGTYGTQRICGGERDPVSCVSGAELYRKSKGHRTGLCRRALRF